jgi:hypothetical protein
VTRKSQTPGYTRGGTRLPDNHRPLDILKRDQETRQSQTLVYTRCGIWWPDEHRPLYISEVGSGDQRITDPCTYMIRWLNKHEPLDIPETGPGDQTITHPCIPLYIPETGSSGQRITDPCIYQRWDQLPKKRKYLFSTDHTHREPYLIHESSI